MSCTRGNPSVQFHAADPGLLHDLSGIQHVKGRIVSDRQPFDDPRIELRVEADVLARPPPINEHAGALLMHLSQTLEPILLSHRATTFPVKLPPMNLGARLAHQRIVACRMMRQATRAEEQHPLACGCCEEADGLADGAAAPKAQEWLAHGVDEYWNDRLGVQSAQQPVQRL